MTTNFIAGVILITLWALWGWWMLPPEILPFIAFCVLALSTAVFVSRVITEQGDKHDQKKLS